jgi:DNA polymerase-4
MFLHLQIPGFHAAVHQAAEAGLRGRPVAVAVDAGPQAPLFATSVEARGFDIWPGLRADLALRRCPTLVIKTPDPERYRAAQQRVMELCGAFTPRVGGSAGRLDLDLAGTESLWRQQLPCGGAMDTPHGLAQAVAMQLRRRIAEETGLNTCIGGAARLLVARLVAALAREKHVCRQGVVVVEPGTEATVTDLMPIGQLVECDAHAKDLLVRCGITTLAHLRALSANDLLGLIGPGGGELYNALHGLSEEIVPELIDPEPNVSACCRGGPGGAGPESAAAMLAVLARELGFGLRQRQLACTCLTLEGRWIDGRSGQVAKVLAYQCWQDAQLAGCATELLAKLARNRREHWERLRLTASGLCAAEAQQEWFAPTQRLDSVHDRVRPRCVAESVHGGGSPTRVES